jgi:hypothetical protein
MAIQKSKDSERAQSGKIKRRTSMLQLMQQNVLLYTMAGIGIFGAASQVILHLVYRGLIRDMEKPEKAKGMYMKQLKQKYNIYRRTRTGAESIRLFIRKSLMEYSFLGLNLRTWSRMGFLLFALCSMEGLVGWYLADIFQMTNEIGKMYLWGILASGMLIAGAYGVTDTEYQRKYLETGLRSIFACDCSQAVDAVDLSEKSAEKQQETHRKKRVSLADLRVGREEIAAAKEPQNKKAELLRQMDPAEQERLIREVLKEFL